MDDNTTTPPPSQLELDFSSKPQKLPFSKAPRKMWGGKLKLSLKALQVEGVFKIGDEHPLYKGVIFRGKRDKTFQRWISKETYLKELEVGREYTKNNKHIRDAYNERKKGHISARAAEYYQENKEKKKEYRKGRREHTRKVIREHYQNNKDMYRARNSRRRKNGKENIKLNDTQRQALKAVHALRFDLDLAAKGAGAYSAGHNGTDRWSFEVHHIVPLLEHRKNFCGLDAPWNVEVLSIEEHEERHSS